LKQGLGLCLAICNLALLFRCRKYPEIIHMDLCVFMRIYTYIYIYSLLSLLSPFLPPFYSFISSLSLSLSHTHSLSPLSADHITFKGLLSSALGSLKPCRTRASFLARSPKYIPRTCDMHACLCLPRAGLKLHTSYIPCMPCACVYVSMCMSQACTHLGNTEWTRTFKNNHNR
jgi:hypothetical protein